MNGDNIGDACEAVNWMGNINEDSIVDVSDVILVLRIALLLDELQQCTGGV